MKFIIIGSSTGGPRILFEIFTDLPTVKAAIIIIQHMPVTTTPRLARRISQLTQNTVQIPDDRSPVKIGTVYIAPGDRHLIVKDYEYLALTMGEKVNFVRPAIDVTMNSLKIDHRHSTLGIILSGMGSDGTQGIVHIKDIGGVTAVQDPNTCTIRSMPESALKTEKIDYTLSPAEIRDLIIRFAGSGSS